MDEDVVSVDIWYFNHIQFLILHFDDDSHFQVSNTASTLTICISHTILTSPKLYGTDSYHIVFLAHVCEMSITIRGKS